MSEPKKFRKKPVVVEAVRWMTDNYDEVKDFCPDILGTDSDWELCIPTLEGVMRCSAFAWIVKGVKGEFYPVKPDIFKETYEPANDD